jgi:hypothetical protein
VLGEQVTPNYLLPSLFREMIMSILVILLCCVIVFVILTRAKDVSSSNSDAQPKPNYSEDTDSKSSPEPLAGEAVVGMLMGGTFDPILGDEVREIKDRILPSPFSDD